MSQSLSRLMVHLVFSTKGRREFINENVKADLEAYMSTIFQACDSPAIKIYAVPDHIHALFVLSKKNALCNIIEEIKTHSSKLLKTKSPDLGNFQWQAGYGAFSVSESNRAKVLSYINGQDEHHKKMDFQEEFRKLLNKHKIAFDERYVWD